MNRVKPPLDAEEFLSSCSEISGLTSDAIADLAGKLDWLKLDGREVLIQQGEPADRVYFVHHGTLRALHESAEGMRHLREHGRGDMIGEAAILARTLRSATIVATRRSLVASLDSDAFVALLARHSSFVIEVARTLSARLVSTKPPTSGRRSALVVPMASIDRVHLGELTRGIAEGARAELHAVNNETAAPDFIDLDRRGGRHVIAVQQLDSDALDVCRQVDEVLLVIPRHGQVDRSRLTELGSIVSGVLGPTCRAIVLHPTNGARPANTGALLSGLPIRSHHHVRAGILPDAEVVGRVFAGRSVSMVFGGGGARGAAHIGVLRALNEEGIHVDHIGGTSMGAILGGGAAAGISCDDLVALIRRWRSSGALRDVTFPTVSLLRTKKTEALLGDVLGNGGIEDLWTNFLCTTVDITSGRLVIHEEGPAALWIRASGSVPGVFPPVVGFDGHLHIDGGMLNNVPADVMRARWGGTVITIDVGAVAGTMTFGGQHPPLGLRHFAERARKRPTLPTVGETLQRGATLTSSQQHDAAVASSDIFLQPTISEFGMFDFGKVDAIVERGYQCARENIAAIRTLVGR
jgi:NTE family protein